MHTRARFSAIPQKDPETCFSNCVKPLLHESQNHRVHAFKRGGKVKQYALDMECIDITNKIGTSDMFAFEASYHTTCLAAFYNKHRSWESSRRLAAGGRSSVKEIALAELVSFIIASWEEDVAPQFRFADLMKLYSNRLNELDPEKERTVHSPRLKEDLCRLIPGLYSPKKTGRDVILTFEADVGDALLKATEADLQDVIHTLSKAAKFIRRRIFDRT